MLIKENYNIKNNKIEFKYKNYSVLIKLIVSKNFNV